MDRITSREIVPMGMIVPPFSLFAEKPRTLFPIAFACVSDKGEGTLFRRWPGTISHKAEFLGIDHLLM